MPQPTVYPIPTCVECGLASAGRCPTCHRHLCMDHFGLEDHQPCAERGRKRAATTVCYVCGVPVQPQQWSATLFAHYIDSSRCQGCRRYICDEQHTALRYEAVELTRRYCGMCAPLRAVGGLIGAGWVGAGVVIVGAIAAFVVLR